MRDTETSPQTEQQAEAEDFLAEISTSLEEFLYLKMPPDLYLTAATDLMMKAYRLEMQATLRLQDAGAKPVTTHLDISDRPHQRTYAHTEIGQLAWEN